MLTHLHSRWFICFPKLRFSDQRKTPQWQTGLCPNNKTSLSETQNSSGQGCLYYKYYTLLINDATSTATWMTMSIFIHTILCRIFHAKMYSCFFECHWQCQNIWFLTNIFLLGIFQCFFKCSSCF